MSDEERTASLGELLRAMLGADREPSTEGPYTHTFTPSGDDEDGWPLDHPHFRFSVCERDRRMYVHRSPD